MNDRGTKDRTDWAYVVVDAVVYAVTLTGVQSIWHLGTLIDTIGDLGAGHGFSDIVNALMAILTVLIFVASPFEWSRSKLRCGSTWQEEQEERRAWLADLRAQGVPRHQRLAQWLSLVVVAAPVMALRRVLDGRRQLVGRQFVHLIAVTMAVLGVFRFNDRGLPGVLVMLAVAVVFDLVGCFVITLRERRIARRGVFYRPAP